MADTKPRRRRGRPPKPPEALHRRTISLRVTDDEHARLTRSAERAGQAAKIGRHVLDRALGRPVAVVPAINRDAWSRLGNWSGAFTTIAQAAAREKLAELYPHMNPPIEIAIEQARAELEALRLALLGQDVDRLPDDDNGEDDA